MGRMVVGDATSCYEGGNAGRTVDVRIKEDG